MNGAGQGDPVALSDTQRRVRRSPLLFTAPLVLFALLVAVLAWEAVRANMTGAARTQWPWRLQLLGTESLGSLVAVAAGAVLARAQYARTVRPFLGWRGAWTKGPLQGDTPVWRVGILNGGQHITVVEAWDCRVVLSGRPDTGNAGWGAVRDVVAELAAAGFAVPGDFQLHTFGAGFPLVGTGSYETVPVGAFSQRFIDGVDALYVRVRVTDAVGDSHERVLDCLKGAKAAVGAPLGRGGPLPGLPPGE